MLYGCEVLGVHSDLKQRKDLYENPHVKFIKAIVKPQKTHVDRSPVGCL